ncbi:hypothetical protein BDP81DRAFT_78985 [Colletotrichum phormii]|uniref:Uncharacterized protein n=1 Tax=Colletotrichum phormii TaxID=359342 RepID=A0AAJ0EJL6_9PEZI|nr:uncharacterized protein BDP81DRAFT_78985 [Colletotrichum phormii]KAK1654166.1 hypothetical protein BDP81DRAFT_78985 [Colletotrichum phormii]
MLLTVDNSCPFPILFFPRSQVCISQRFRTYSVNPYLTVASAASSTLDPTSFFSRPPPCTHLPATATHPQSASPETKIYPPNNWTNPPTLSNRTCLLRSISRSPTTTSKAQQTQAWASLTDQHHKAPAAGVISLLCRKPPIRLLVVWTCCVTRSRLSLSPPSFLARQSGTASRGRF